MNSEEKKNEVNNEFENKEEGLIKRKSLKYIKQELLMQFNPEDEKKDSNVVYNEVGSNKKNKIHITRFIVKKNSNR